MLKLRALAHSPAHRMMLRIRFERRLEYLLRNWHRTIHGRIIGYGILVLGMLVWAYYMWMILSVGVW